MTWKEFKEAVESAGVCDSDVLGYIDVSSSWIKMRNNRIDVERFLRRDEQIMMFIVD